MLGEVTGDITTSSSSFILSYAEPKSKHECTHCGFEADLYESGAKYECPICKAGILCRAAQNTTFEFLPTMVGPWTLGWTGYEPITSSADTPLMADGYLFVRR